MDGHSTEPRDTEITTVEPAGSEMPAYEPPKVTVMDEAEVLKAFQFTSAAISWWVM
jgi:hypothetical protein